VSKTVISNSEHTTKTDKKVVEKKRERRERKGERLEEYHARIKEMSEKIVEYASSLEPENLLSVKMAVMRAVALVEERMRERRES